MPTHESSRHSRETGESKQHRRHRSNRKRKHSSSSESPGRQRKKSPSEEVSSRTKQTKSRSRSPPQTATKSFEDRGGAGDSSLSIDETNKLRAELGLAPLEVDGGGGENGKESKNDDVHLPPVNYGAIRKSEQIKEKIQTQKEKREIMEKLTKVKGLGEVEDEEIDSAANWVRRSRQLAKEKEIAEKRAKILDEMDADFGIGNLIEKDQELSRTIDPKQKRRYGAQDLAGLRVEHDVTKFKEGSTVILTLKDRSVLEEVGKDEDEELTEVLINVNMHDDEKLAKNLENKRKSTLGWKKAHLEEEGEDVDPMEAAFRIPGVLDKYNVEIEGDKKKSFTLIGGGKYETDHEKALEQMRAEMRAGALSLSTDEPRIASDFLTEEEMSAKFKKRKRRTGAVRKRLTVDELLSMPLDEPTRKANEMEEEEEDQEEGQNHKQKKDKTINIKLSKVKDLPEPKSLMDVDIDEDLRAATLEPDEAEEELQRALQQVRKLQKKRLPDHQEELKHLLLTNRKAEAVERDALGSSSTTDGRPGCVILNATREYCRNIGITMTDFSGDNLLSTMPTSAHAESLSISAAPAKALSDVKKEVKIEEEEEEDGGGEEPQQEEKSKMIIERMVVDRGGRQESTSSGWQEVNSSELNDSARSLPTLDDQDDGGNNQKPKGERSPELRGVLDDEPALNQGLAAALQFADKKGYIDRKKAVQPIIGATMSKIIAKNFIREDVRYDDIDAKFAKRDRFNHGPLMDFKDKDGYKPDFKLEYVDDMGRQLNEKEAFRQLSHRFHGKGSGKRKTERRIQKVEEEMAMAHMSSSDTPLGSSEKLHKKLESEGLPYVVLSGKASNVKKLSK